MKMTKNIQADILSTLIIRMQVPENHNKKDAILQKPQFFIYRKIRNYERATWVTLKMIDTFLT